MGKLKKNLNINQLLKQLKKMVTPKEYEDYATVARRNASRDAVGKFGNKQESGYIPYYEERLIWWLKTIVETETKIRQSNEKTEKQFNEINNKLNELLQYL